MIKVLRDALRSVVSDAVERRRNEEVFTETGHDGENKERTWARTRSAQEPSPILKESRQS